MSLKTFHLLFVTASVILALGFGAWGIEAYTSRNEGGTLILALLSFLFAAGLLVYGIRVRAKLKGMDAR